MIVQYEKNLVQIKDFREGQIPSKVLMWNQIQSSPSLIIWVGVNRKFVLNLAVQGN